MSANATKMDQSRVRAERENVEYVETLGVHWRNLSVHFKDVQALAPCSGDVEAGQAVALMGPTGCGKTSLLNALARRGPPILGDVERCIVECDDSASCSMQPDFANVCL